MRYVFILMLIAASLGADQPRAIRDEERLVGSWWIHRLVYEGREDKYFSGGIPDLEWKGGPTAWLYGNAVATWRLDPGKRPATVDYHYFDGRRELGIYKFVGDSKSEETLWVCVAPPPGARPTEFEAKKGTKWMLYVYKRKPKPD